jgi:hypothetical protein
MEVRTDREASCIGLCSSLVGHHGRILKVRARVLAADVFAPAALTLCLCFFNKNLISLQSEVFEREKQRGRGGGGGGGKGGGEGGGAGREGGRSPTAYALTRFLFFSENKPQSSRIRERMYVNARYVHMIRLRTPVPPAL